MIGADETEPKNDDPMSRMSASRQTCQANVLLADDAGLHLRPAAELVSVASQFDSDIIVEHQGRKANGKSLLSVVMLCAEMGARLTVLARGEDAPQAVKAIRNLFKRFLGEGTTATVGAVAATEEAMRDGQAIVVPAAALAVAQQGRGPSPACVEVPCRPPSVGSGDSPTVKREVTTMTKARQSQQPKRTHTFVLNTATQTNDVSVAGEFSQWDLLPMVRRNGVFQASVRLVPGTYQYKFVVDGQWVNDPACGESVPNGLGSTNSVVRIEG